MIKYIAVLSILFMAIGNIDWTNDGGSYDFVTTDTTE